MKAPLPRRSVPADSLDFDISRRLAGRAGATAAGIMLAVQLIWRLNWSTNGVVQAFPEFIVAAVSRLTPLSVFGAATENYGGNAKKALFVAVLLAVVAVGRLAGLAAARLAYAFGRGFAARLISAAIVATILFFVTAIVILPLANLGVFARHSSYASDILTQLVVTFAVFAIAWALLTAPSLEELPMKTPSGVTVTRRTVLSRSAATVVPVATTLIAGESAWRLIHPHQSEAQPLPVADSPNSASAPTATGGSLTVDDIVATQRADQGYNNYQEVPDNGNNESSFINEDRQEASLISDEDAAATPATPEADPFALFNGLQENGQLTPVLTDTNDFYHVSKNISDPTVSSSGWKLEITGLVNTPLTLTLDQLTAMSTTHKITTLGCISNELNGDLIGSAEWIGVPLADLLTQAGVQPSVVKLKMHAADDYEDSITIDRATDPDTMVVVGMNGKTLRDDHGYPCRLIVPGIYGMKNVKWLDKIEAIDDPDFLGYWQQLGWSDPAPFQIWGRIDYPKDTIDPGPGYAYGVASAGDRGISRVEVSFDNGATWADAELEPALNPPLTWVRWAIPFTFQADEKFDVVMRATDGNGTLMIEKDADPLPNGATGWPSRSVKVRKAS